MLFDRARIHVEGGRGGSGVVSFRREAHVPRGGPDGGDGGRGGDVVAVCDPSRRDLSALGRRRHFRAGRGGHGQGKQRHGARGEDLELAVPPGTLIETVEGDRVELLEPGQRTVLARGGSGGHGNKRFATSTRRAPRFAERGLEGEAGSVELRLRLLADAGLVGLPNAGKSSLLARVTRARPKVAGYPFTTLEPVLGTLEADDRQVVLADIPGLIEGAAEGAGLGHEFLAHVERCRLLLHLVDIGPAASDPDAGAEPRGESEPRAGAESPPGSPSEAYRTVRGELAAHGAGLEALPELVVLAKRDLLPEERVEELLDDWRERLEPPAIGVIAVSSPTGAGLDELRRAILAGLPEDRERGAAEVSRAAGHAPTPTRDTPPAPRDEFEAEHRVYRPGEDEGFQVEQKEEGRWRVRGRGIEMLVARHDLGNEEALAYIERRLAEIGVIAELRRAGFESGDEVIVGEHAFELHP